MGHTDKETLLPHVHLYSGTEATVYTDEWRAYERVERKHQRYSPQLWIEDFPKDVVYLPFESNRTKKPAR